MLVSEEAFGRNALIRTYTFASGKPRSRDIDHTARDEAQMIPTQARKRMRRLKEKAAAAPLRPNESCARRGDGVSAKILPFRVASALLQLSLGATNLQPSVKGTHGEDLDHRNRRGEHRVDVGDGEQESDDVHEPDDADNADAANDRNRCQPTSIMGFFAKVRRSILYETSRLLVRTLWSSQAEASEGSRIR